MPTIAASQLKKICAGILLAVKTPAATAESMADNLVNANIQGVDSHGCRLLPGYIQSIEDGLIVPPIDVGDFLNGGRDSPIWRL